MKPSLSLILGLSLLVAATTLAGCTNKTSMNDKNKDSADAAAAPTTLVTLALDDQSATAALVATPVTDVKVLLVCDGYAADAAGNQLLDAKPDQPLTIFGHPTNCTLRLRSFKLGAAQLLPKDGADFVTFQPGERAVFTDGVTELEMIVITQLPAVIEGNGLVRYGFSQVLRDADVPLEDVNISVTEHTVLVDGEPAPGLGLVKARLVALGPLQVGLRLTLACDEALVGDTIAAATCLAVPVSTMEFHLGPKPDADVTAALLQTLFTAGHKVLGQIPGIAIVDGKIELNISLADAGISRLQDIAGKQLLFALRRNGGVSYRYAFINVPDLPILKQRACKHVSAGAKVVIPHGTIYEDAALPRFAKAVAKECRVVGHSAFTCTDGQLFGPAFPDGTFAQCRKCSANAAQTDPEGCK